MDPARRRLLLSLALAPLGPMPARAAPAAPAEADGPGADTPAPVLLRAGADGPAPDAPLRYGAGPRPPLLRVRRGATLALRLENGLARPTSLDLHGIRLAPALGEPGPLGGSLAPGAAADLALVLPDAGTAWFHPWALDPARDDTARGLAGLFVVEEDAPDAVDADLVALVTDRPAAPEAGAAPPPPGFAVDGMALPRREVLAPGARLRLRLVNGSTRRSVTLAVSGAVPTVVALDGQPAAAFRPRRDAVPMAPGARCDLVLDMPRGPGGEVTVAAGTGPEAPALLVLRSEGAARPPRGPVQALPSNPALPEAIALERATRATLSAAPAPGGWAVNGVPGRPLPPAPLFRARRGAPVSLALRNGGPALVGFRLHGFCFRLLHDLDDGWEPYWRDTVMVQPGATHHIAFVADRPGRWLIESPVFAQAAGGLRAWFEVS